MDQMQQWLVQVFPPLSQHHPGHSFAATDGSICLSGHLNVSLHSDLVNIFDAAS